MFLRPSHAHVCAEFVGDETRLVVRFAQLETKASVISVPRCFIYLSMGRAGRGSGEISVAIADTLLTRSTQLRASLHAQRWPVKRHLHVYFTPTSYYYKLKVEVSTRCVCVLLYGVIAGGSRGSCGRSLRRWSALLKQH